MPDTSIKSAGGSTGHITWLVLVVVLGQDAETAEELQNQLMGLAGLISHAAGTAVEAGLAVEGLVQRTEPLNSPTRFRKRGCWGSEYMPRRK